MIPNCVALTVSTAVIIVALRLRGRTRQRAPADEQQPAAQQC
jgi:hypothetical protein